MFQSSILNKKVHKTERAFIAAGVERLLLKIYTESFCIISVPRENLNRKSNIEKPVKIDAFIYTLRQLYTLRLVGTSVYFHDSWKH